MKFTVSASIIKSKRTVDYVVQVLKKRNPSADVLDTYLNGVSAALRITELHTEIFV